MKYLKLYFLIITTAFISNINGQDDEAYYDSLLNTSVENLNPSYKPVIGVGTGVMNFFGEVRNKINLLLQIKGIIGLQEELKQLDPDYYNREMGISEKGAGMYGLLERIKREYPIVQFGYFNRTKENFFPEGYENGWPVR